MSEAVSSNQNFRDEVREWLLSNCPDGAKGPGQLAIGSSKIVLEKDVQLWLERCAETVSYTHLTLPTSDLV